MGNEPHLEAWRSRLLRLSDGAFLDLMRNYLGKVETPYNKHDLINRLTRYLKGEEVQEAILGAIDEEDAKTVTAVALLPRPTLADLSDLFPESVSFLSLHEKLRNLEDRLLLFRDLDTEVLYLNPILEHRLQEDVLDPSLLIEVRRAPESLSAPPWITDGLLLALTSVTGSSVSAAVAKRSLTKRELAELTEAMPALAERDPAEITSLIRALVALGVLEEEEGSFVANLPVLRRFGDLEYIERLALIVAALAGEPDDPDEAVADAVVALIEELSPEQEYRESALRVVHHLRSRRRVGWESLAEPLVLVGLLSLTRGSNDEEWYRPAGPAPAAAGNPLTIQAGNEVNLEAGVRFAEGLAVAMCGTLKRHDLVGTYEITRESIAMADQRGFPIQELPGILAELTTRELPQSLSFNLDSWLSERAKLSLTFAAVLTVDEDRRAFLDGNHAFADYVLSAPAPGVYLLDPRRESEWRRLLTDLGFPHLPRNRSAGGRHADWAKPQPSGSSSRLRELLEESRPGKKRSRGGKKQTKSLLEELGKKDLPTEVAKEMALRIEKKLILFSKQLSYDIGNRDRQEARGLDYVGKVRVIEQALREGDETLEVVVKRNSGEPVQMRVRPEELQKQGTRLLLRALTPEGEEVSFPVEKISLVRRLRGFLISR